MDQKHPPENVHAATDPQKCVDMGKRYGWRLKAVRKTKDPTLKVDCVFDGEQTSFEDERYE
jgi:hypothetical protein